MKSVCIIFLGHFNLDARCINMAETIINSKKYNLSIINLKHKSLSLQNFKKITFFNLTISNAKFFKYYDFHSQAKKIVKTNNFDIIISSDLYSLSAAAGNSRKLIYDCREIYSELEAHISKPLYKKFWFQYEKYYLRFVNHIIVNAESDKKKLHRIYKLQNIEIDIIFNFPKYQKYQNNFTLRKKFNIEKKNKIILYQGVVQKGRGLMRLIKLIQSSNKFTAVVIGDGPNKKIYTEYVNKQNLKDKVFFIEAVPYLRLLEYTASADIGWLVINKNSISNQLALPNKLFEYILMGLPVLSSNIKNVALIIKQFNIGQIVENESDLVECLTKAISLSNSSLSAEELHQIASKNFVWHKQKNNFLDVLI